MYHVSVFINNKCGKSAQLGINIIIIIILVVNHGDEIKIWPSPEFCTEV